jgi:16S rRNA (cytosine967-C5)-methyltransferase
VLASDTHPGRLRALARELAPAIADGRLLAFRARADEPAPLATAPATIVLDAPCTGLGTLSRRPDIKWKRTEADVATLAELQARILDNALSALTPGGMLHYITCTLSPAENQRQVARLLAARPEAALTASWTTPPDVPAGEFFYCASLQKRAT